MYNLVPWENRNGSVFDYLDHWEKNLWEGLSGATNSFKTDIIDKGDKYLLQAELPGFEKKDIYIDIDGDYLTIQAEKDDSKEYDETDKVIKKERYYHSYARSFRVSGVEKDKITAEYKNGVLEMALPKTEMKHEGGTQIEVQ
ncbi:MAG: Hsp20/alpha crystallin family protein [Clostridia bacterium]|nr:Hsp20/alpha crystallin family protein [Clostridia bacterium]